MVSRHGTTVQRRLWGARLPPHWLACVEISELAKGQTEAGLWGGGGGVPTGLLAATYAETPQ